MPVPKAPSPLPRGRHNLPREEVERSQRERLLRAMVDVSAERGYAGVSVADVIAAAGVSRATFYALFTSKEDCFMAAFEAAGDVVISPGLMQEDALRDGVHGAVAQGIGRYLDGLAEHPAITRMFMVEVNAAGPEAMRRRFASLRARADAIADALGRTDPADRAAVHAFVLALSARITEALVTGEPAALPELRDELVALAERLLLSAR